MAERGQSEQPRGFEQSNRESASNDSRMPGMSRASDDSGSERGESAERKGTSNRGLQLWIVKNKKE